MHQLNLSVLIGFVKTFAILCFITIFYIFTVPFSTTSQKKWYWTPMCLVLEWKVGFLAICKALWLSQNKEILFCLYLSSSNKRLIQITSLQAYVAFMCSASIINKATIVWSFETQLTAPPVIVNTSLVVDFFLSRSLVKFEST